MPVGRKKIQGVNLFFQFIRGNGVFPCFLIAEFKADQT